MPLGRALLFVLLLSAGTLHAQGLFSRFRPVDRVSSDSAADYTLTQQNGPWLIMAATFTGEGAQQQAQNLAVELRQKMNVSAYIHDLKMDLSTENVGRGVDRYGNKKQMKYQKGSSIHEWAVLVGDFPNIDDPEAQRLLRGVKTFEPDALKVGEDSKTYQTWAAIRRHQERIIQRVSHSEPAGPMRTAFVTRNPLLPQEYFVPKGVDKFVADINKGVRYSLLDMKARYTVKVATFRGESRLQTASVSTNRNQQDKSIDPLVEAAENAHLLTEEIRRVGVEAYEFHDRYESYVTIGSFDEVKQIDEQGRLWPTDEMMPIFHAFGAAYNTPADPLQRAQLPTQVQSRAASVESQFKQVFAQKHGTVAGGLHPKFARIPPNDPRARVVPFDIHPTVIEAPKRSVSGSFNLWR
ncbi:MAG: hypothetical protein KDA37_04265 [Planctomycetales bacterium]|nr:hypothetical protein [Planctomycetales bacterium]